MKKSYKIFALFLVLATVIFSCNEEEMTYIDPMIDGVCGTVEKSVNELATGNWSDALVGFRTQRIKLLGIRTLLENDGYTGEEYALKDPAQAEQRVAEAIALVEMKLDSVWDAEIADKFADIDQNSPGVSNFGTVEYASASNDIDAIYAWLYEDTEDATEVEYISNDISGLTNDFALLKELSDMLESEVTEYITSTRARFATMQQQYANLALVVESSGYFSKAQKDLYASLKGPIDEMEPVVNGQITLGTNNELDVIDRDLSALVYFVDNNYTSPAQRPVVWGEISSITELRWLSEEATVDEVNGNWLLTADIDAAETVRWNQGAADGHEGFKPILHECAINFDGGFHIISHLYMVCNTGGVKPGIFTFIQGGSVKNLGLYNMTLSSDNGQGSMIVGQFNQGSISKVWVTGEKTKHGGQSGTLLGRVEQGCSINDCFTVADLSGDAAPWSALFIGLPIGDVSMHNCYMLNTASSGSWSFAWAAFMGYPVGVKLNASGIFWDSAVSGSRDLVCLQQGANYSDETEMKLEDDGIVTDLPSAEWSDLSMFKGFSSDVWEIKTVTEIDEFPRPYLKGFNYDAIKDFIVPE
ncbi:hypothetical protein [uncultured Draconibacterium sp.]|uniref:hypothetical protein n=1 Tax=uncultured Draconibacterium sp. TaxID=1573823 RepID=UPI0032614707